MVSDFGHNALEGGHRVVGVDLGTSSTHDLGHLGVRTNHRNRAELLTLKGEDLLLVLEQDAALRPCLSNQRAMLRQIDVLLWHGFRVLEEARFDQ